MTPHRDSGQGTLLLDRRFRGVGRVKRASGTTNKAVLRKVNRMLTALFDEGRLDLLRALRDGELTPLALLDAYQRKSLDRLPTAALAAPLAAAWLEWVLAKECSIEHKRSLVQSLRHILNAKIASPFSAELASVTKGLPRKSVADLPALLAAARKRLAKHPTSFRLARSAAQAFARETLKRSHPLYRDVSDVAPMTPKPQRLKRPQTVAGLVAICATVDEETAAAIWSMATTGMGPKEYWGRWERETGGIHIHGTKRAGRDRLVPDMGRCKRPALSRQAFEDRLVEQAGAAITPYDLRRTFANWMEAVGITRARRRIYMGHGAKDVTDMYEWHEVLSFLETDGLALRTWLEVEMAAVEQGPKLVADGGK